MYIKGTGCITIGWMIGSIFGFRISCRERVAVIIGGMDSGMLKGCIFGGGGEYFFIGGLEEGMFNLGEVFRCEDWNFSEEGEFLVEGGEFRLFTVRFTGFICISCDRFFGV